MAIDAKYGKVTLENSTIGEDEPVFVFRAQDALLPEILSEYLKRCLQEGATTVHLRGVIEAAGTVRKWQKENGSKLPGSRKERSKK